MKIYSIIALFAAFGSLNAEILTQSEAIETALKNNYDVQISRVSADIDKANNTPGNAGLLPTAAIEGSGTYAYDMGGDKNISRGALSGGVALAWTIYDGGKMYVTRDRLAEIEALGELNYRNRVMKTVYNVTGAYCEIARLTRNLETTRELIEYNNTLVQIAETGFNAGDRPKNDLLLAKIDLNTARQSETTVLYSIQIAKQRLNEYMGVNGNYDYEVETGSAENMPNINREEYLQKMNSGNLDLKAIEMQIEIARYAYQETSTASMPTVQINGGYYLTKNFTSGDVGNDNFTHGPQVGASLSIPLFTAGENDRKANVAQLEVQNAEIEKSKLLLSLNIELENTISDYENQRSLLALERENGTMAKENFEINLERFRNGETTAVDVRQARNELQSSNSRLADYEYAVKLADTKLKLMIGEL